MSRPLLSTVEFVLNEPQFTDTSYSISTDIASTRSHTAITGRARCSDGAGTLAHLFFSDDDFDIARAKAVCRSCERAPACLDGALERGEVYGVWGGTLVIDGVPAQFARRRGRPPAHRIETVAEEVPIPEHLVA